MIYLPTYPPTHLSSPMALDLSSLPPLSSPWLLITFKMFRHFPYARYFRGVEIKIKLFLRILSLGKEGENTVWGRHRKTLSM